MRISERLKKIKKSVGSNILYQYSDEYFTQIAPTAEIIGIHVYNLYNIQLIVKCDGMLSPLNTTKKYKVSKIINLPLIKVHLGKMLFPQYNYADFTVKTVFVTKNDIDSSLIKNADFGLIEEMDEIISAQKINLAVKKAFVCDDFVSVVKRMLNISVEEAKVLVSIGMTPYGWRNSLDETNIFDPRLFDTDVIHDINCIHENLEELHIYSGLLKLSEQKYNKKR